MKNMTLKITLALAAIVSCMIGVWSYRQVNNLGATTATTTPAQDQEQKVWDYITTTTGITRADCTQRAQQQEAQFIPSIQKMMADRPVRAEHTSTIRSFLHQRGLNPDSISLMTFNDQDSAASASIKSLRINEQLLFDEYDEAMRTYVLEHEITHLIHNDPGIQHALMTLLQERFPQGNFEDVMITLSKFCEERADQEAFLANETAINGGTALFAQQLAECNGVDLTAPTHPNFATRFKLADNARLAHANRA